MPMYTRRELDTIIAALKAAQLTSSGDADDMVGTQDAPARLTDNEIDELVNHLTVTVALDDVTTVGPYFRTQETPLVLRSVETGANVCWFYDQGDANTVVAALKFAYDNGFKPQP